MKPVRFRAAAINAIMEQSEYLLDHAPHVVELLRDDMVKTLSLVREFPDIGRPGDVPGTREVISIKFRYIIIYVIHESWLEVLRVYFRGQGR